MPRRGESTFHSGSIWGRHISSDTFLQRIEINSKDPAKSAAAYLILSRGGAARVYAFDGSSVSEIPPEKWREPLLNGLIYSPFDLLAPYKGWPAAYAGPGRIVKAVHFFDLVPGAEDAAANPGLKKVRVALSREFNAPFQTEFFGPSGVERVLSLDSVKRSRATGLRAASKCPTKCRATRTAYQSRPQNSPTQSPPRPSRPKPSARARPGPNSKAFEQCLKIPDIPSSQNCSAGTL